MEFSVKQISPEKHRTHCLVVGVFENAHLSATAKELDTASHHSLSALLKKGDMNGKIGHSVLLHNLPNVAADRVLLVGCGNEKKLTEKQFAEIIVATVQAINQTGATDATLSLTDLPLKDRRLEWKIRKMVQLILGTTYSFNQFKTEHKEKRKVLKKIVLTVTKKQELSKSERAVLEGQAIANGMFLTKDLANLPGNICTPEYLAKEAKKLAAKFSTLSAAVLNEKEIAALKMGALLSVGQGSQNPPRLITLEYQGRSDKQKPIVLVGKGITFDTGGNSLKPPMNMIGMKFDMCGAAAVLGAMHAAAELELPLNLVGVIAAAENMPGSTATRPEDIVTTLSGLTVEILNTDAEGRLVLCDALTYCERFNPDVVIDMATLTGACIMALGYSTSALLSNQEKLARDLLDAGTMSGDRCWQLPLWDEYQEHLKSNFADLANISTTPQAGTILAGCFLSRFTKNYAWAHLDIAGTASSSSGKERGATGRPVPLIVQYLLDRCA